MAIITNISQIFVQYYKAGYVISFNSLCLLQLFFTKLPWERLGDALAFLSAINGGVSSEVRDEIWPIDGANSTEDDDEPPTG